MLCRFNRDRQCGSRRQRSSIQAGLETRTDPSAVYHSLRSPNECDPAVAIDVKMLERDTRAAFVIDVYRTDSPMGGFARGSCFRTREIVVGENPLTFASSRMAIISGSPGVLRVSAFSRSSVNKLTPKRERFRRMIPESGGKARLHQ